MSLSEEQLNTITAAERATSVLSVFATGVVIATFLSSRAFRKPINRVVFYASWGNILTNVGTLISRSAIIEGAKGADFCRFQGFIIQWFMPADALWTFAMAFNVYLTFFHKYDAAKLVRLEWKYALLCYGLPFIPAFAYFFINSDSKGPVYGSAVLWCWVAVNWDILRIAVFYCPVWFVIILTFAIYARVGYEISRKRRYLRSFNNGTHLLMDNGWNPDFEVHASKVVHISSESRGGQTKTHSHRSHSASAYPSYSVTVQGGDNTPPAPEVPYPRFQSPPTSRRLPRVEVSSAAFAYCKYALLYFLALVITWVPSTINRVYSLVHPTEAIFGLELVSAFVLPLQGFWNGIIYIAVSWTTVTELVRQWRARRHQQASSRMTTTTRKKRYTMNSAFEVREVLEEDSDRVHDATSEDTESTKHFATDTGGVNREM